MRYWRAMADVPTVADWKRVAAMAILAMLRHDTQAEAAKRLGTKQPTISALQHGDYRNISLDRMLRWLVRLGCDVEIRVQRRRRG